MVWPVALTYLQSGYVLAAITLFILPVAAFWFARSGRAWENIGKGGRFGVMHAMAPPRMAQPSPEIDLAIQAAEARQMLEAKSYRRTQRGEEPLDVEAEVNALLDAELVGGGKRDLDEKLRAEVRDLVVARNERRMRRGEEPLDVEAEVERQVADFIGLGR